MNTSSWRGILLSSGTTLPLHTFQLLFIYDVININEIKINEYVSPVILSVHLCTICSTVKYQYKKHVLNLLPVFII